MQLNFPTDHSPLFLIEFLIAIILCSTSAQESRIVGGEIANRNEFPWLVRIQRKSSKSLLCGGAIIKSNIILTAAHCLNGENPKNLEVVAGEHDVSINEGLEQTRNIKKAVMHANYNPNTYENDICLLKLSANLNLVSGVNIIPLPPLGYFLPENSTVAGWGLTTESGSSTSSVLRKVSLPIVPNNVCSSQYRGIATITSNMCCAGIANKDSCQGDSGGPLMCSTGNGTVVCGITSFGVGCGKPGYSGVYTKVSEYRSFIADNNGIFRRPDLTLLMTLMILFLIVT